MDNIQLIIAHIMNGIWQIIPALSSPLCGLS